MFNMYCRIVVNIQIDHNMYADDSNTKKAIASRFKN